MSSAWLPVIVLGIQPFIFKNSSVVYSYMDIKSNWGWLVVGQSLDAMSALLACGGRVDVQHNVHNEGGDAG